MKQQELADKLYVTIQTVSQWENGKTQPDSDRILLLAKLLGTTADALLDGSQPGVASCQAYAMGIRDDVVLAGDAL